jgi:ankyrin repeat protein
LVAKCLLRNSKLLHFFVYCELDGWIEFAARAQRTILLTINSFTIRSSLNIIVRKVFERLKRRERERQLLHKAVTQSPPSLDKIQPQGEDCNGALSVADLPLHYACSNGAPLHVVRYCVQQCPESLQVAEKNGDLPLHHACSRRAPLEVVRYLVQEYPESIKVTNTDGDLPLHYACVHGSPPEVVRYLVQEHPESLQVTNTYGDLPLHFACNRGVPLEVVQYLVQEYPKSLQVTDSNGNLPLHNACNYNRGSPLEIVRYLVQEYSESLEMINNLPLHHACIIGAPLEVVSYLVEEYPESLQVTNNDGYLPLHEACSKGAPLEVVQYLVQEYPMSLQLTSSSGTEPIDLAKNHEVKTWMEYTMAGGVAFEASGIDYDPGGTRQSSHNRECKRENENEKDSAKLSVLVSQFDELNLLADEKRMSVDEKEERDAIRSSKDHWDFYYMFIKKMRGMVTACETLASGMVASGNDQSFRSFAVQTVQERSLASLKETKIGVFVAKAIKWSVTQIPFPFVDAIGSVFQTLATLKDEHDKCLGVARVADFATIAAIEEDVDSVHRTIERTARYLIRSRRFVGTKEEFGPRRQRLLKLMAEPGCTQSKAEACIAADEALAGLMKPVDDCPVRHIVERFDRNTRLDEALAALILGSTVLDIKKLETFTAPHPSASGMPSSVGKIICTDGNGCRLQQRFESTTLDTSAQVQALENQVAELSVSHATQQEVQARLAKLTMKIKQLEKASGGSGSGSGSGLVQMHADFREEYKDKLDSVEGESIEHGYQIGSILEELAIVKEEMLRIRGPSNPQQMKKDQRFWNPFHKKMK